MSDGTQKSEQFDENKATGFMDLYSRQIGTFGVETMRNLAGLRVLIIGLKGVGVETAKDLILAGPGAVTLFDNNLVETQDLGTNFFFTKELVGKAKRSEACSTQLKQLNPFVDVTVHTGELTDSFLLTFGAIVVTDNTPLETLIHIDELCHNNKPVPILFVLAVTVGVTASIFSDFGPTHLVTDRDGEPARVNPLEDIKVVIDEKTQKPYLEITVTGANHGLDDGALVTISDVSGMTELNSLPEVAIKRIYKPKKDPNGKTREVFIPNKLRLDHDDIPKWGHYKSEGVITEVKTKATLEFKPLKTSLLQPLSSSDIMPCCDDVPGVKHPHSEKSWKNFGTQIHFARLALWEFQKRTGDLPKLHDSADADTVVSIAEEILAKNMEVEGNVRVKELNEDLVRKTALYSRAELPGVCAFLGGVVAQEIIKKFGKYTPIHQWMHVDYLELLADTVPEDAKPVGSRYDHQISIFGKKFQDKLGAQKWFMVGCGALGCEYLKGFALMGLGANGGSIGVTDMDRIEVSNLNRQFLFRRENVGQPKSVCAANAASVMNPDIKIVCYETPVSPDTENVFGDSHWQALDGVCNALDNIKAREFVDSKCVFFEKPLLESGTLGTKANSEIVLPHKTKSYAEHEKANDAEDTIPMCTLRNFPHLIEHCIEWARSQFTDRLEVPPKSFNDFVKDPAKFFANLDKLKDAEALNILTSVKKIASWADRGINFETCIHMAFSMLVEEFRDRIKNLTSAFPENAMKKDPVSGESSPFWSGAKRFPQDAQFNLDDELHVHFLYNLSNLYAVMFKLQPLRDVEKFKELAKSAKLHVPEWQPSKKFASQVQSEVQDEQAGRQDRTAEQVTDEDVQQIKEAKEYLATFQKTHPTLTPLEPADFEKDDDTNFHIDFITACSNLRAWNYHIKQASRHKCKMIAGKIIPAVATTTAMITGLVTMELYKIVMGLGLDKFCNSNINLGTGSSEFNLFEPVGPKKAKAEYSHIDMCLVKPVPDGWTTWDRVVVDKGDLTVQEFIDLFPSVHHGCKIESLFFKYTSSGKEVTQKPIWVSFAVTSEQKASVAKNSPRKLSEVFVEYFGEIPGKKTYLMLDGSVVNSEGDPATIPPIKFVFGK